MIQRGANPRLIGYGYSHDILHGIVDWQRLPLVSVVRVQGAWKSEEANLRPQHIVHADQGNLEGMH